MLFIVYALEIETQFVSHYMDIYGEYELLLLYALVRYIKTDSVLYYYSVGIRCNFFFFFSCVRAPVPPHHHLVSHISQCREGLKMSFYLCTCLSSTH